MPKEALKFCLLPKETRYFISEHSKTKTVKKKATDVSVPKDLPFGEASKLNEATTKKKGE
jgi:hypothetical protein